MHKFPLSNNPTTKILIHCPIQVVQHSTNPNPRIGIDMQQQQQQQI